MKESLKEFWEEYGIMIFAFVIIALVLGLCISYVVYENKTYYTTESTPIFVTIVDKDVITRQVFHTAGKTHYYTTEYDYYIKCKDCKFEVDEITYNNYNCGEILVISKTCKYRRDTEELVNVEYTYNNNFNKESIK